MKIICEPQGQGVVAAVGRAGVVVGGQDDDQRPDLPVLNGVIHDVLERMGTVRGSHQRGFIAPATVAEVHHIILLIRRIAVGEVYPGGFGQGLGMAVVGEGLPGLILQLFQRSRVLRGDGVALRDVFQLLRDRPAAPRTKKPAHDLLIVGKGLPARVLVLEPVLGKILLGLHIQHHQSVGCPCAQSLLLVQLPQLGIGFF